ncbi:MAG: hypothetical protein IJS90_00265 [Clostridia bacterium]|nr:hypothetical protein [Clostridia bacterium]
MKKATALILALIFILSVPAAGFAGETLSGEQNGVIWTLTEDGTLTLTGEGQLDDYPSPWDSFSEMITKANISAGVKVGRYSFWSCENLEEINYDITYEELFDFYVPYGCVLHIKNEGTAVLTKPGNSYAKEYGYKELRTLFGKINFSLETSYTVKPSASKPYAIGKLDRKTLDNMLNEINFFRAVAHVDSVTDDETLNELAQAATVTNAAIRQLTHYPDKPDGMSDSMYELGRRGASSSNLAAGYSLLGSIQGYLEDSDSGNISRVGHRRWVLSPYLGKVGIGSTGSYSALRVFDESNEKADAQFTAWPGGNRIFPAEFFYPSYAMSVQVYGDCDFTENASATITRLKDGKKVTVNKNTKGDGAYFNVDTGGYGSSRALIFRPPYDSFGFYSGKYNITVTGVTGRMGLPVKISYDLVFLPVDSTLGDVDGDNRVTASDARTVLRCAVKLDYMPGTLNAAADCDFDGQITAADARLILRAAVNLEKPEKWYSDLL